MGVSTRLTLLAVWLIIGHHICQSSSVGRPLSWEQQAERDLEELEKSIRKVLDQRSSENDVDREVGDDSRCREGGRAWERTLEATRWLTELDQEVKKRSHEVAVADWNYLTNLTDENSNKYEELLNQFDHWWAGLIDKARGYMGGTEGGASARRRRGLHDDEAVLCNDTTTRLLKQIIYRNSVPMAKNPEISRSINHLVNQMSGMFSTFNVTRNGETLRLDPELTQLMATSRDYEELKWAWLAWHNVSGPPIRPLYKRLVDLMNEAARDNGFNDVGEAWNMADYESTDIEKSLDELFAQVKPFYDELHAYVRSKLVKAYPGFGLDETGPIPAHLLGNMWAQQWDEIFDLVAPYPDVSSTRDITGSLKRIGYTARDMFLAAEYFFTSLGLEPMTQKFWDKSIIERPSDNRPVVCHGSAHDFYTNTDFRIKMCTTITSSDFYTVHHEMGHIQYFMQYRHQHSLYRTGANAAFHEAVGDTVALSVATPTHLQAIGLVRQQQQQQQQQREIGAETEDVAYKQQINYLMQMALIKVAFLPFAYVMDKWRFAVFRGEITPDKYNEKWWEYREKYQGLVPPSLRSEEHFDPAAKYHITTNVPYTRYFFSFISQFQFHEALCLLAGHKEEEELSMCDIYQSQAAGDRLKSVLSLGASKPWPEVMRQFTGQSEVKIDSLLKYFRPLTAWLKTANRKSHPAN